MDLFEKYFGKSQQPVGKQEVSLFREDNENGGKFLKAKFIPELQAAGSRRPSLVTHTKLLLDSMQAKRRFASPPQQSYESGISVTWCHVRYGNTTTRLCVPNITGMVELIADYENGRIVVSQTFDELMRLASGEVDQSN